MVVSLDQSTAKPFATWRYLSKYIILDIQSKKLFMFLIFEQHSYRTVL